MKKLELTAQSSQPNFIGSWLLDSVSVCDELINYFESNEPKQRRGATGGGRNFDVKNSVDMTIAPNELELPGNEIFKTYFKALFRCYQDYTIQWPFLKSIAKSLEIAPFNIQRYQTGQHFQKVHTERNGIGTVHRVFAWMTYLNDVDSEDGGSTTFTHYNLDVQPQKGLTLIWPAEWTHAHRGNVLNAKSKYVITGWMNFGHQSN